MARHILVYWSATTMADTTAPHPKRGCQAFWNNFSSNGARVGRLVGICCVSLLAWIWPRCRDNTLSAIEKICVSLYKINEHMLLFFMILIVIGGAYCYIGWGMPAMRAWPVGQIFQKGPPDPISLPADRGLV